MSDAIVISLNKSEKHTMQKYRHEKLELVEGFGVKGDAHYGKTVKHRSRVKQDPTQPNLRQVHLIHQELLDELSTKGFSVQHGQMGENITTKGIDLLNLPTNTVLKLGTARIMITGLRNPCSQLDGIQEGLMKAVLDKNENGDLIRKAGIMAIVLTSGEVGIGDKIEIKLPEPPHIPLQKV